VAISVQGLRNISSRVKPSDGARRDKAYVAPVQYAHPENALGRMLSTFRLDCRLYNRDTVHWAMQSGIKDRFTQLDDALPQLFLL
jgi:hypothetical protein